MLLNLKAEMFRYKVTAVKICKELGISQKAMSNKVQEHSDFSRKEMYIIHDKFFPNSDFYKLFLSDKKVED